MRSIRPIVITQEQDLVIWGVVTGSVRRFQKYVPAMPEQVLALVDCNNFYASCERGFNPKLDRQPVVVLSNNDGCIIARSNEAKALGFAMGDPYHLSKDKIRQHNVRVFSSNYALYGDMSRRVMNTLETLARAVKISGDKDSARFVRRAGHAKTIAADESH